MNPWGWSSSNVTQAVLYPTTTITASGTSYPYFQPQQLVPVLESPSAPLSDRDWLDAQVEEVCALAEAA